MSSPSLSVPAVPRSDAEARVGVILLRYNGPAESLERAVRSVLTDNRDRRVVCEVMLVDNGSTVDRNAVDRVGEALQADHPDVSVSTLNLGHNLGFSGAVNQAVASLSEHIDQVLLLNDDARLDGGALAILSTALAHELTSTVSVAPKLYLDAFGGVIESVGMVVNERGEARNVGLGQFDLGQFDEPMVVLGPTFAAALIRRSAFAAGAVGLLPAEYFLYYEDVEWNWRATLLGYRTMTVPSATGVHAVSGSSRTDDEASYGFKHRYIEANLLQTVGRLFETSRARQIWLHRWPRLVKARVTGRFPKPTFGAAIDAARAIPRTLRVRKVLQQRRVMSDSAILALETPHLRSLYDPVTYQPEFSWAAFTVTVEHALERVGVDESQRPVLEELLDASKRRDSLAAIAAASGLPNSADIHTYVRRLVP